MPEGTRDRNRMFEGARAGRAAENSIEACLLQQLPNDCFLVDAELAREVGYRSPLETVSCVDVDFGIRLGLVLAPGEMAFVDAFVGSYRRAEGMITLSGGS
jgi:hypothetical protein